MSSSFNQIFQDILKRDDALEPASVVDTEGAVRLGGAELLEDGLDGVGAGASGEVERRGPQLLDEFVQRLVQGGDGLPPSGEGEDVGLGVDLDDDAVVVEDGEGGELLERSEERRVGKECRSRWSP